MSCLCILKTNYGYSTTRLLLWNVQSVRNSAVKPMKVLYFFTFPSFRFKYSRLCHKSIRRTRDWFKIRTLYSNLFLTVLYMIIYPLLNHPFLTFANNRKYPSKNVNKYPSRAFFFNLSVKISTPSSLALSGYKVFCFLR